MIVRDEAYFLVRCLDAVRDHVDEIVVVDTGSKDNTVEIARRYTPQVYEYCWHDDFAAARNHAVDRAAGEWLLVLDADEIILPSDLRHIRQLILDTDRDVFFLQGHDYSDNPMEPGWQRLTQSHPLGWAYEGYSINPIARLFRRRQDIRYVGKVHEVVAEDLPGVRYDSLEAVIHHDTNGNPFKPKADRQRRYLEMIEHALEEEADGRLASYAGRVRMYYLQDFSGAIERFQQAVELGYQPQANLESLAEASYRIGRHSVAKEVYGSLYESGYRRLSLCNNYANLLVRQRSYSAALEVLEHALTLEGLTEEWEQPIRHNITFLRTKLGSVDVQAGKTPAE